MTDSHAELLGRAVKGDHEAVADLLQQHAPELRRRLTGEIPKQWQSVLSEDDVLQQTYADAFLDIGRFQPRGEGSFMGWLTTMAKRNLIDAIRLLEADKRGGGWQRIEPGASDESFVALYELLGGSSTTPSRRAAREEAKTALQRSMERLPEDYRQVIRMYDLEGQPLKDVARAMNRTTGAVSMLRGRSHRRLAEILGTASQYLTGSS